MNEENLPRLVCAQDVGSAHDEGYMGGTMLLRKKGTPTGVVATNRAPLDFYVVSAHTCYREKVSLGRPPRTLEVSEMRNITAMDPFHDYSLATDFVLVVAGMLCKFHAGGRTYDLMAGPVLSTMGNVTHPWENKYHMKVHTVGSGAFRFYTPYTQLVGRTSPSSQRYIEELIVPTNTLPLEYIL